MSIKKWMLIITLPIIIATSFFLGTTTAQMSSSVTTPGSADDPLITKSYVDEQVSKIANAEITKIQNTLDDILEEQIQRAVINAKTEFDANNDMQIVTLNKGFRLIVKQGGEIIVRAGNAIVFSPDQNGVSNITSGKDLAKGATVPQNSLLIFPRDGRGIQHTPSYNADLIVLVRGSHEIKKITSN
jgi:hypothetical protein